MNIYENNDFSIYEKLKTIIDSGEEFDLTITINVIGIDESNTFKQFESNTFKQSTITYTLKHCKILTIPQKSYTNVDEPSSITYDVELYYGRFEISIS